MAELHFIFGNVFPLAHQVHTHLESGKNILSRRGNVRARQWRLVARTHQVKGARLRVSQHAIAVHRDPVGNTQEPQAPRLMR